MEESMKFIKVEDQLPPLNKNIIVARQQYSYCGESLVWSLGFVIRPFEKDKKFNPDYYELAYFDEKQNGWEKMTLEKSMYWMDIELPILEKF